MSEQLDTLHRLAHRRHRDYSAAMDDWRAYRAFAASLVARLPFRWHAVPCDNPTQNHTGSTNGQAHIVVDESVNVGRLHRKPGDPLCRPLSTKWGVNLWGESDGPTCKRCLEMAERITEQPAAQPTPFGWDERPHGAQAIVREAW